MKKTTNIYFLVDCSQYMAGRPILKFKQILKKYIRALAFSDSIFKVQIIGFNNSAAELYPHSEFISTGTPNLGEALKRLYYLIARNETAKNNFTRSIIMLHTSGTVLSNWAHPLQMLFSKKEFAFAHRYVITYGKTDGLAKRAFLAFADTEDKILPYFSESRLCSLVKSVSC